MSERNFTKKEAMQMRIKGHKKSPLIDRDLQLEIPVQTNPTGWFGSTSSRSHRLIYPHYSSSFDSTCSSLLPIEEKEWLKAMEDARKSHEAWKQMRTSIIEKLPNSLIK